jgi:hypothetical protein
MSQVERLFWRADYEVSIKLDGGLYKFSIPREYLEVCEQDGEDIHKAATEFVLDGLEENRVICKDLRKILYLHVFNTMLRQLPLKAEGKSWLYRMKKSVGF